MNRTNRIVVSCIAVLLGFSLAESSAVAATWHVNAAQPASGDGATWNQAFKTLQEALAPTVAQAGDQIWVATGTYKPTDAASSFDIPVLVKIYGGFPATGNPGSGDRNPDPETNGTILDGDINGDDSEFSNFADNCLVVVDASLVNSLPIDATVLDGFTIRGAQQHGILNDASILTYTNLLITENQWVTDTFATIVGAGMYCNNNSDVVVTQTIFRNNRLVGPDDASGYGTAIAIYSGSDISMTDCVIEDNLNDLTTPWGGGMYSEYSSPTLRRVVFRNNEARGGNTRGGGLCHDSGTAVLIECDFENNRVTDITGYSVAYGGGVYSHRGSTMINCEFTGNTVKLTNGSHSGDGGGLYAQKECWLTNCRFTNNSAQEGGGIYADNVVITAENCTIADNSATSSGGVMIHHTPYFDAATFTNCILWGNLGGDDVLADQIGGYTGTGVNVTYSCVQDAAADGNPEMAGTGNIDLDPMFVDTVSDDYHIERCSPCVDAADTVAVDIDSRDVDEDTVTGEKTPDLDRFRRDFDVPEVTDTGTTEAGFFAVDMGSFEYQIRGDVNLDGPVDGEDIQPFTDCVLGGDPSSPCQMADMDLDGDLDIDDVPCFVLVLLGDTETCFGTCGGGGPRGESDCNANGTPDMTDILLGTSTDCDENLVPDECDIALCLSGDTLAKCDCNENGLPDACDEDCNKNGVPDECDVVPSDPDGNEQTSEDCNENGIPDECDYDCNDNLIPDECDIATCLSSDAWCRDCNENSIPDGCEEDCNENGVPDDCDIDPSDPDGNGQVSEDCNENQYPDECDLTLPLMPSFDCNDNLILDECDIATCLSTDTWCQDCNENGIPDGCDIDAEISEDENENGIPDECELMMMMGGGGGNAMSSTSTAFESIEAEAEAWLDFYEWSEEQNWGPTAEKSGADQFKAAVAKLKELGLPVKNFWYTPTPTQ